MNKRQFKAWRRELRAEARRRDVEERSDSHRGSYDNTITDPITRWKRWDLHAEIRNGGPGDFKSTTPYKRELYIRKGNNVASFNWYKDSSKDSGVTGVGIETDYPTWWGGWSFTASKRSSLLAAAQRAIVSKVASEVATWDILTDSVESGQTVSLLRESASWFYQLARTVRGGNPRGILQHLGIRPTRRKVYTVGNRLLVRHKYALGKTGIDVFSSMSNLWLTYRYGFMPTIYSMRDAFETFTRNSDLSHLVWKRQVTLSESVVNVPKYSQVDNGSGLLYTLSKVYTANGSIRHKAYVSYEDSMSARLGLLSPSSLLNTAWEEVPFSYVYDWFVNIGDYLKGLGLSSLVSSSSVNTTEKGNSRIYASFGYSSKSGWRHVVRGSLTGGISESKYFERSRGSLRSQLPTFDPWYTWNRALDTASLSWQRTKKYIHT